MYIRKDNEMYRLKFAPLFACVIMGLILSMLDRSFLTEHTPILITQTRKFESDTARVFTQSSLETDYRRRKEAQKELSRSGMTSDTPLQNEVFASRTGKHPYRAISKHGNKTSEFTNSK